MLVYRGVFFTISSKRSNHLLTPETHGNFCRDNSMLEILTPVKIPNLHSDDFNLNAVEIWQSLQEGVD